MEPDETFAALLERARAGDARALDELLGGYREQLRRLAQARMGRRLGGRVDASDIVQETLLEAGRDIGTLRATGPREVLAWLRRILQHNVVSAARRHLQAEGRAVGAEAPLSGSLAERLALIRTSPSQGLLRKEETARILAALEQMPPDQGEVVRLRYLEGCSLREIAARIGRTEQAVASLLKRGLRALRDRLGE